MFWSCCVRSPGWDAVAIGLQLRWLKSWNEKEWLEWLLPEIRLPSNIALSESAKLRFVRYWTPPVPLADTGYKCLCGKLRKSAKKWWTRMSEVKKGGALLVYRQSNLSITFCNQLSFLNPCISAQTLFKIIKLLSRSSSNLKMIGTPFAILFGGISLQS